MRLFALDLHISVIADLRDILKDHEIVEWSLSGHNWVFGRNPATPEVITQATWQNITPEQFQAFRNRYDSFFRGFDGFLTGHVMPYVMLFEPFGKPVFAWNTCRFDLPFCFTKDRSMLPNYYACLQRMLSSGQLRAFSNNRADQDYFRISTGLTIPQIPSLCRYTSIRHQPLKNTFLWYSDARWMPRSPRIVPRPYPFQWSDLGTYRAIIHLPYEISTMSLCEQYQAGIPLFLPTKAFLKTCWQNGAPWQSMSAYWGSQSEHPEFNSMDFWLDRADFYDPDNMRFLYYYDDFHDLLRQLEGFTDPQREARLAWIAERESRIVGSWNDTLKDSPTVPVTWGVAENPPLGGE